MNIIAKALLETKAVHIQPNENNFYTWTSGRRSPIYCDNRQLISHPEFRNEIVKGFVHLIKKQFSDVELIAGTATAGIPWAAWIANELALPMVYIRSKPKGHGMKTAIEGHFQAGQKTLIIEDLISTGKSSLEALDHCTQGQLETLSILSIFTYGFKDAIATFENAKMTYHSLCNVDQLLSFAKEQNLLNQSECDLVLNWRNSF